MAKVMSPGEEFAEIDKIQAIIDKVFTLVASKGNIKPKHLEELLARAKDLKVKRDSLEMTPTPFSQLQVGKMSGGCVAGRVVKIVSDKQSPIRRADQDLPHHGQGQQPGPDFPLQLLEHH